MVGLGIVVWWWLFPRLPGEIAVRQYSASIEHNGLYTFKPGLLLNTGRWRKITPSEVYVWSSVVWSPDFQHVAFRCSDGSVYCSSLDQCWLDRPDKIPRAYDPQRDIVKHGICLVDRDGENFYWITASTETFNWRVVETSEARIQWTLDGRYIVFLSRDIGQWYYYDLETGETGHWKADLPTQDSQSEYVNLPDIHIPKGALIRARIPCTGTCLDEGWTGVRGVPSADGRYITWIQGYGESDPQYLIVYDLQAKRLLRLARTNGFSMYEPVWLPNP